MEKKKIRVDVGDIDFDAESGAEHTPIKKIEDWLAEMKDKGATHIDWYASTDYDGGSGECSAEAFFIREETDEEAEKRIKQEREFEKGRMLRVLSQERAEYERLKKKFSE